MPAPPYEAGDRVVVSLDGASPGSTPAIVAHVVATGAGDPRRRWRLLCRSTADDRPLGTPLHCGDDGVGEHVRPAPVRGIGDGPGARNDGGPRAPDDDGPGAQDVDGPRARDDDGPRARDDDGPRAPDDDVRRLAAFALGRALGDALDHELLRDIVAVCDGRSDLVYGAHQRLLDLPGPFEPPRRRALDLLLLAYVGLSPGESDAPARSSERT